MVNNCSPLTLKRRQEKKRESIQRQECVKRHGKEGMEGTGMNEEKEKGGNGKDKEE